MEELTLQQELESLRPVLDDTQYGAFLILPLKYDNVPNMDYICRIARQEDPDTVDISEPVKAMLSGSDPAAAGTRYRMTGEDFVRELLGQENALRACRFFVENESERYDFAVHSADLYLFHTKVAFLSLGLTCGDISAVKVICNPGYGDNPNCRCGFVDENGGEVLFSLENLLGNFARRCGLRKIFDGAGSMILESFGYMVAVLPRRFKLLETIRHLTFSLHKMMPLDALQEDVSEDDIRYAYAARDGELASYRWGCCVSSQTVSYVVADAQPDIAAEMAVQAQDGVPVAILALYQKYTCLRFTELIRQRGARSRSIYVLKKLMLEFQAYGTITPANLSRWHNVKQIYAHLLEVNDVAAAIEEIGSKIDILTEQQRELESARNSAVLNIITIFGIVSILASVLSIIQILSGGDMTTWIVTILTTVGIAISILLALMIQRK